MRKALRCIAFFAGVICAVSVLITGWIYLEKIIGCVGYLKTRIANLANERKDICTERHMYMSTKPFSAEDMLSG